MNRISRFYRISAPAPAREMDEAARDKYYRRLRMQAFIAATLGYSLYYVCRTSLNVMKKPILDSGSLDASQLGVIGSALLFAYAIGKFVNGFIADYCNIKRFMATGLIVSAAANMLMGVLGLMHSVIPTAVIFIAFAVMWGLNGWSQSMGAAPAIISLSRWYPLKERGTYYGFFSASHNLGEFFSFLFVGSIVTFAGWQAGFFGSAIAGAIGVVVILLMLHDTPESKGLPPVELHLDAQAAAIIDGVPAAAEDFDTEYLDYKLSVAVVEDVDAAIAHIARHSTHHSEAIITADAAAAQRFTACVDSAAVYVNASTRFTDGGEFGLGCEMGISTQKLHARGPMGLAELCTYKYIVHGNGQVRGGSSAKMSCYTNK